ncbi:hypothetical protein F2Q68_00043162 [Brassica cretica]|uniref:Uncharacterized protein n=1 Tax=Brassica cretica TaxID=69181 RepID=A0A8S9LLT3_BRACR|nr:hypothetical protein F2Q68_00043162 [Brassica cretica]
MDPLSNPIGSSRSLVSHTPSPRNLREHLDFPKEAGGSGSGSHATSSERRSALARLGGPLTATAPPLVARLASILLDSKTLRYNMMSMLTRTTSVHSKLASVFQWLCG